MRGESKDWTKDELIEEYVKKYTPVTIPVNVSIEGQQTIIDLSSVEKMIREAKVIAVQDCGCRKRLQKCSAPLDVCLSLDNSAKEAVKDGAKEITKPEALEVMRRSHEAGLVHVSYITKGQKKPLIICSCCSCCCHSLSALVRFGIPDHVVASEYIAHNNDDTCNGCGTCVERCQFHARQLVNDKVRFDPAKCFGCGVCITTCPTKSIELVTRTISTS